MERHRPNPRIRELVEIVPLLLNPSIYAVGASGFWLEIYRPAHQRTERRRWFDTTIETPTECFSRESTAS